MEGPGTSETPECQDETVRSLTTVSAPWTQSPPQASCQIVCNHSFFHRRGSEAPKGFFLSASRSTFLRLGEEAPLEFQPSLQATATSLMTGCGGCTLRLSAQEKSA